MSNNRSGSPNEEDINIQAVGGQPLPQGKFLPAKTAHDLLRGADNILPRVPDGDKEDVFFLVDNARNVEKRKQGVNSVYYDDRGAWQGGPSNRDIYQLHGDGSMRIINYNKDDDHYYLSKTVNRKRVRFATRIEPRPTEDEVITVFSYYTKHANNPDFVKKVTWISTKPEVALYEYKGKNPDPVPHKNTTTGNPGDYLRLREEVSDQMAAEIQNGKNSMGIYNDMVSEDAYTAPRNRKQVYNKKTLLRKENSIPLSSNFADQTQALEEHQKQNDFVQVIIKRPNKVVCAILYNEEQIEDIKRFCCGKDSEMKTVIGVDKTFNLSDCHVTVTVFKNLSLRTRRLEAGGMPGGMPIFFGPIFLHGNSDANTYSLFFTFLKMLLSDKISEGLDPIFGSDEEQALRIGIQKAFPNSPILCCTRHLRQNLDANLSNNVGLNEKDRSYLTSAIFSTTGQVANCLSDAGVADVIDCLTEKFPGAESYLKRLIPMLCTNMRVSLRSDVMAEFLWTNNNSESLNHTLKEATQWRSLKLLDLVKKIEGLCMHQYAEAERAICGKGEFMLGPGFEKFLVQHVKWHNMPRQSKEKKLRKFLKTPMLVDSGLIQSTDGETTSVVPTSKGKKPGQRKRKVSAKTRTPSKKRRVDCAGMDDSEGGEMLATIAENGEDA